VASWLTKEALYHDRLAVINLFTYSSNVDVDCVLNIDLTSSASIYNQFTLLAQTQLIEVTTTKGESANGPKMFSDCLEQKNLCATRYYDNLHAIWLGM